MEGLPSEGGLLRRHFPVTATRIADSHLTPTVDKSRAQLDELELLLLQGLWPTRWRWR